MRRARLIGGAKKGALCFGLLLLVLGALFSNRVIAQTSEVQTVLCDNQAPDVQISQPMNGETVTASPVNIVGTAERTSTIEVFKNSSLVGSAPITYSGNFSIPINLSEGANEFEVKASFNCNGTEQNQSLQITYVPPPNPPEPTPEGRSEENASGSSSSGMRGMWERFISGDGPASLPSITGRIEENLGLSEAPEEKFEGGIDNSYVKPVINWMALVTLFLAFIAFFAPLFFFSTINGLVGLQPVELSPQMKRIFRILCLILIILLSFLLQL